MASVHRTAATPALTSRQLTIIRAKAMGLPNKEIASQLGIARNTLKYHVQRAYHVLGVSCLADALRELGWLRVPAE